MPKLSDFPVLTEVLALDYLRLELVEYRDRYVEQDVASVDEQQVENRKGELNYN